jgi:hypothetical protein
MKLSTGIAAIAVLAAAVLAVSCSRPLPKPRTPLGQAASYLWRQQAPDGGWHSHTYGLLHSGQSLTPFVLTALLAVPEKEYPPQPTRVDRALAFIADKTRADGALGLADSIPDYPNYSTALAVLAICRARRPGWDAQAQRMTGFLRTQQFTEQNGWTRDHPAYGAWGMGGARLTPPDTGHVDLSMTRYVLQALRAASVPASDPLFEKAGVFVSRCQAPGNDGGFFFTTTEFDTNKAGMDGAHFRTYGTTTADGILAMTALGWPWPKADPPMEAAATWLKTHHRDMLVPGFVGEAYQRWPKGLSFYYAAAASEAFHALGVDAGSAVQESLKASQRADGSWMNPENLVKEDDPLIATPFAIRALVAAGR